MAAVWRVASETDTSVIHRVLQDKQERNKCVPSNLSVMLQEGTQDTDRM